MTEKKTEKTPQQQYHLALHAMPSSIGFNAQVSYGKTTFEFVNFKALRDAVLPILDKHDLSVQYKTEYLDGVSLLFGSIVHKDGETVGHFGLPLRTSGKPQDLGSEITYFKRYALAALCGVVSDKDDDGNFADKAEAERENAEKNKPIDTDQKKVLLALIKETDTDVKAYLKNIEFASIDDITVDKFENVKGKLENKKKQMEAINTAKGKV